MARCRASTTLDKGDTFQSDQSLDEANATDFAALMLPGGVANPDFLRSSRRRWPHRTRSLGAFASRHRFDWVLPGHGGRVHRDADELHAQLEALVARMAHA